MKTTVYTRSDSLTGLAQTFILVIPSSSIFEFPSIIFFVLTYFGHQKHLHLPIVELAPRVLASRQRSWKYGRQLCCCSTSHHLCDSSENPCHDSYLCGSQPLRQASFYQHLPWPLNVWYKLISLLYFSVGILVKTSAQAGVYQTW